MSVRYTSFLQPVTASKLYNDVSCVPLQKQYYPIMSLLFYPSSCHKLHNFCWDQFFYINEIITAGKVA